MQHVENDLDTTIEKLSQTNQKYDEKDKLYQLAEGETQVRSLIQYPSHYFSFKIKSS